MSNAGKLFEKLPSALVCIIIGALVLAALLLIPERTFTYDGITIKVNVLVASLGVPTLFMIAKAIALMMDRDSSQDSKFKRWLLS